MYICKPVFNWISLFVAWHLPRSRRRAAAPRLAGEVGADHIGEVENDGLADLPLPSHPVIY